MGYNNQLKQAGPEMKLSVNNEVNPEIRPQTNGRRVIKI